jgi:hypothetical protein
MRIEILVTDRDLNILGPVNNWISLDVTLRFNEPASGQLVVPMTAAMAQLLTAGGNRIVVKRNLEWFVAGPIERPGKQRWSADGDRTYTVVFTDDFALIAGRRVYPDPANSITAQSADRREFAAVNAEDVMQTLVDENAGPGALAARRIPRLVIASDAGVGSNVTMGFRLDPLGDALRSVALAGGGLGIRTQQVGDDIETQVYEPQDLTGSVVFSTGLGNLIDYSYDPEAPRATVALVGDGTGTGTSRVFVERISPEAATWWRLETVVDRRDTTITAELEAAGDEELSEQAATASLSAVCVETPQQRFGTHYRLGDLVLVILADGTQLADIVRAVRLVASPRNGEVLSPIVGTQSATTNQQWIALVNKLRRDVGRLQAI